MPFPDVVSSVIIMDSIIEGWKIQLQKQLEIEQNEIISKEKGLNIEFIGSSTGLAGRCIVQLQKVNVFSNWEFRNGDIAQLVQAEKTAVVYKVTEKYLYLAFEDEIEFVRDKILKLPNTIVYKRLNKLFDHLLSKKEESLYQVCFNGRDPLFIDLEIDFLDDSLNDLQKLAVKKSLKSLDIHMIHGPPGTGKTCTLIEIIRQLLAKNKSILVCGPSNISVDNIVERLSAKQIPCLRIGHPARLLPSVQDKALEYIVDYCTHGGEVLYDIKQEIDSLLKKVHSKSGKEKYEIYKQVRILRKEFNLRERKVVSETCRSHLIHCSTLTNAMNRNLNKEYDVVIVDEVAQSIEPEVWLALSKANKAIIAGDPFQLPPVVKSKPNKLANLEISIMERLFKINNICTMLTTQYRMNKYINEFPNKFLYHDKLVAHPSCAMKMITDYDGVTKCYDLQYPVIFYDNLQSSPEYEDEGKSKYNDGELENIKTLIEELIAYNIPQTFIGIIAAYNAQVSRLKSIIPYSDIEINTVDGYQGREKEVIIISTVKCNSDHDVGFLTETRRMNVAISRAKHLLILFGDSETLERHQFLHNMVEWASQYDVRYFSE